MTLVFTGLATKMRRRRVHKIYAHWSIRALISVFLIVTLAGSFQALVDISHLFEERIRYILSDKGEILNVYDIAPYDVIISAYMNSGSTYTGRVLGHREDVFYFYEPLWRLSLWGYYRQDGALCSTREHGCRQMSMKQMNWNHPIPGRKPDFRLLHDNDLINQTKPIVIPQRILNHVLNCRLKKLINLVQPGVTEAQEFAGPSWQEFRSCVYHKYGVEDCLGELETNVCKQKTNVVTKVLRLTVSSYREILNNNKNVKVVHLFRDPRAIIHSRMKTPSYPIGNSGQTDKEIDNNVKALCEKMEQDLDQGKQLAVEFPNRFRFIMYEDVHENEQSLIALHSFIGMAVRKGDVVRARESVSDVVKGMEYSRRQQRTGDNSFWWRQYMPWRIVKKMGPVCGHVLQELGYQTIISEQQLRQYNRTELLANLAYTMTSA